MAQALFLAVVYAIFIFYDVRRIKREGGRQPIAVYVILMGLNIVVTMLFFFNVELIDPQKMIVELVKGLGLL